MEHDQTTTLGSLPRPNTKGTVTYFTAPAVQDKPRTIADSKGHDKRHHSQGKHRNTRPPSRSPFRADACETKKQALKVDKEAKTAPRPTKKTNRERAWFDFIVKYRGSCEPLHPSHLSPFKHTKRMKTNLDHYRPSSSLFFYFFRRGEPLACFPRGIPFILVPRWGSVNKLRLRRPREFGRPGILEGCFTAPEESVDRILQLQ